MQFNTFVYDMDAAKAVSEPLHGFMIDSVRLVRRCNKPDRKGKLLFVHATFAVRLKPRESGSHDVSNFVFYSFHFNDASEFLKISTATAVGFAVMGLIGFFVRLVHIPVNSILLGMYTVLVSSIINPF